MTRRGLFAASLSMAVLAACAGGVISTEPVAEDVRRAVVQNSNGSTYEQYQLRVEGLGWFAAERDLATGAYVLTPGGRRDLQAAQAKARSLDEFFRSQQRMGY